MGNFSNTINKIDPSGLSCIYISVPRRCHYYGNYYDKLGYFCGWERVPLFCTPEPDNNNRNNQPDRKEKRCTDYGNKWENYCWEKGGCYCGDVGKSAKRACMDNNQKNWEYKLLTTGRYQSQ